MAGAGNQCQQEEIKNNNATDKLTTKKANKEKEI
jgi:hypothetical protein